MTMTPIQYELGGVIGRRQTRRIYNEQERCLNQHAIELLQALQAQTPDPHLLAQYADASEETDREVWSDEHYHTLGRIGFGYSPPHVDDVMRRLLEAVGVDVKPQVSPEAGAQICDKG